MAGRFAWIMAGGAAILAGMAFQGDLFDGDGDHRPKITIERDADGDGRPEKSRIEQAVEEKIANAPVVDDEGRRIEVSRVVREELAAAVTEKVKSEAALALLEVKGNPPADEIAAAKARIAAADARVEAIEARLDAAKEARSAADSGERQKIRDDVRTAVREGIGN